MIKEITKEEASTIIENRMPFDKFWLKEGQAFAAIDNTSGDAWTEEFPSKRKCLEWLKK